MAIIAAVLVAPLAYVGWRLHAQSAHNEAAHEAYEQSRVLSAAERTQLRAALEQARKQLASAREAWALAVTRDALAQIAPSEAACPHKLHGPSADAAESFRYQGNISVSYATNVTYHKYSADQPLVPVQIDDMLKDIDQTRAKLDAGTADRDDANNVAWLPATALFVVADHESTPIVNASTLLGGTYTPATLTGMAYLFSLRQGRVTCAGNIDATSIKRINFKTSIVDSNEAGITAKATEILERDFEVQVMLASALRAVE